MFRQYLRVRFGWFIYNINHGVSKISRIMKYEFWIMKVAVTFVYCLLYAQ